MFTQSFSGSCFVNYFTLQMMRIEISAVWEHQRLLRAGNQLLFNEYCIHIPLTCQFVNAIRRYLASNRRGSIDVCSLQSCLPSKIHFYTGLRNHNIWLSVPLYCIISELLIRHQLYYTDGFS